MKLFLKKWIFKYRTKRYSVKIDPLEIDCIQKLIKEGDTVVDIGSHKGAYLYFLRKAVGASGTVHVFEPQSILYQYLKEVCSWFGWTNVFINHSALSSDHQLKTLQIPVKKGKSTSPGASLSIEYENEDSVKKELVNCTTLDDYLKEKNQRPTFLKIDVEGHEWDVLQGAKEFIAQEMPTLLIEIESRHCGTAKMEETINWLCKMGYNCSFFTKKQQLPYHQFEIEKYQNIQNKALYANNFLFERA